MLRELPTLEDPNILLGSTAADDAGIYKLDAEHALIQTVDFFTPIVDDGYTFGAISATNAVSDVYAMGGHPLTALNILAYPPEKVPQSIITEILKGGNDAAKNAGCAIIGGHTLRNKEPIYGLAVTGLVSPDALMTKSTAQEGDYLILTKPLGTGIITTALKRSLAPLSLIEKAIQSMKQLNSCGPELLKAGVIAATDVSGYGLSGHLSDLCRASNCSAELWYDKIPLLDPLIIKLVADGCVPSGTIDNMKAASEVVDWGRCPSSKRTLICDAQTSGGLLLSVKEKMVNSITAILSKHGALSTVIGRVLPPTRKKIITTPSP